MNDVFVNSNTAIKADRFYRTATYKYNGNIVFSEEKSDLESETSLYRILKFKDNRIYAVYSFSKNDSNDTHFSIKEYLY